MMSRGAFTPQPFCGFAVSICIGTVFKTSSMPNKGLTPTINNLTQATHYLKKKINEILGISNKSQVQIHLGLTLVIIEYLTSASLPSYINSAFRRQLLINIYEQYSLG